MHNSQRILVYQMLHIISIFVISLEMDRVILSAPTYMKIYENKAIQSRPGAKAPKTVPGVCQYGCMNACANDENCLAYTFDANEGLCKIWDHFLIELVNKPMSKSYIRGIQ